MPSDDPAVALHHVTQASNWDCGLAAVAMVLAYYGNKSENILEELHLMGAEWGLKV